VALATLYTDPTLDWVTFPSGESVTLGPVSPLEIVNTFCVGSRNRDNALFSLATKGFAMFPLNREDVVALVEERTASHRRRISNVLVSPESIMDRQLKVRFAALEMAAVLVKKAQASGGPVPLPLISQLKVAAEEFCEGCNALGVEAEDQQQTQETPEFQQQTAGDLHLAEETLALLNQTETKIANAVKAGKKFNATAARGDLYKISTVLTEALVESNPSKLSAAHKSARNVAKLFPL
jgi:hypothetical protein